MLIKNKYFAVVCMNESYFISVNSSQPFRCGRLPERALLQQNLLLESGASCARETPERLKRVIAETWARRSPPKYLDAKSSSVPGHP